MDPSAVLVVSALIAILLVILVASKETRRMLATLMTITIVLCVWYLAVNLSA